MRPLHNPFSTMIQLIIFTDLDGTLIDHDTYDFKEAGSTLGLLARRDIPVIICSSKTRAEIELYWVRMGLSAPFVVENGGAVFIPANTVELGDMRFVEKGPYRVLELGAPHAELYAAWRLVKKQQSLRMTGFTEMTVEEVAAHTGLSVEEAGLAAKREYSEPFIFSDTKTKFRVLRDLLQKKGLSITRGGRFYHMTGQNDKGMAVQILTRLYGNSFLGKEICTVGLGDSANDVPMLRNVDIPVVIRKKTGQWERIQGVEHVTYSDKAGPRGWAESVRAIL